MKEFVKEVGFGEAAGRRTLNVDTSTSLYLSVCKCAKIVFAELSSGQTYAVNDNAANSSVCYCKQTQAEL